MITLTNNAASQIGKLYSENGNGEEHLRIVIGQGGCSGFEYGMAFDKAKEEDHVLEKIEVKENEMLFGEPGANDSVPENDGDEFKLLIDNTSLQYMSGSIIDFDGGLSGKGFEIRNPNATSTCGCGRSFN